MPSVLDDAVDLASLPRLFATIDRQEAEPVVEGPLCADDPPQGAGELFPRGPEIVDVNGRAVPIDTEYFTGEILMHVKPSDEEEAASLAYFTGRKRLVGIELRGTFKRRISFDDLTCANVWRPVLNPGGWQRRTILFVLSKFLPHLRLELGESQTSISAPVCLDAKRIIVGGLGEPLGFFSLSARKRHFRNEENRKSCHYEPGTEYYFEFYQHVVSFDTYKLSGFVGLGQISLAKILRGQPFQFCLRLGSNLVTPKFSFYSKELLRHGKGVA